MGVGEIPAPFLIIMSELAIMAIISVVSTIISSYAASQQQKKEFGQQQLLQEDAQQFQAEREDLLFQRNSIPEQYQQMLDAGFNPILAASSLMGGNGVAAASSDSSPSAPTTNSAIGALSSMLGQGGQNLYDLFKQNAEVRNLEANTNKTEVEAGLLPRDYELRRMSTAKQLEVWNASIEKMQAETKCSNEEADLIKNQNIYYGRKSEAEIQALEAKVAESYSNAMLNLEKIKTEQTQQSVNVSQVGVNQAQIEELHQRTLLEGEEASKTYYEAQRERISKEFEESLGGIPLTADAQKYVNGLVKKGDLDGVRDFYMNIFATAANQELGQESATSPRFGLPFNLFQGSPQTNLKGNPFHIKGYAPYWNPYLGNQ